MAGPLLAAVCENMAVVSDEYFNNARQEIQSLRQSFSTLKSPTFSSLEI